MFLCAFFSRSSIFFLNCLASFSSEKLSPYMHSSPSNEWKNVRSWLYWNVSNISWSQSTPRFPLLTSTSLIQNVFPTVSFASTAAPCKPEYVHLCDPGSEMYSFATATACILLEALGTVRLTVSLSSSESMDGMTVA